MMDEQQFANVDQLFAPMKRRHKTATLPVSGNAVRIQSLTEREVSAFQSATIAANGTGLKKSRLEDANRRLIVLCLVDGAGNRILNDSHIAKLADWDGADTAFLYNECIGHVGLKTEDIEGLVKNSEGTTVVD